MVRPTHYLQQGTFGKEGHLLPQSFYTNADQVQFDVKGRTVPISPGQAQEEQQQPPIPLKESSIPESAAAPDGPSLGSNANPTSSSNIPQSPDSYTNIGGSSGRLASALTNVHEYGEVVPKAFSNLQHDSYAYYHGHRSS